MPPSPGEHVTLVYAADASRQEYDRRPNAASLASLVRASAASFTLVSFARESRPPSDGVIPTSTPSRQQNAPPAFGGVVSQSWADNAAGLAHVVPPRKHFPPADGQALPGTVGEEQPITSIPSNNSVSPRSMRPV